jgi:hypothetical protein
MIDENRTLEIIKRRHERRPSEDQELREKMQSFESETKRLNEIIGMTDRMVEA